MIGIGSRVGFTYHGKTIMGVIVGMRAIDREYRPGLMRYQIMSDRKQQVLHAEVIRLSDDITPIWSLWFR